MFRVRRFPYSSANSEGANQNTEQSLIIKELDKRFTKFEDSIICSINAKIGWLDFKIDMYFTTLNKKMESELGTPDDNMKAWFQTSEATLDQKISTARTK